MDKFEQMNDQELDAAIAGLIGCRVVMVKDPGGNLRKTCGCPLITNDNVVRYRPHSNPDKFLHFMPYSTSRDACAEVEAEIARRDFEYEYVNALIDLLGFKYPENCPFQLATAPPRARCLAAARVLEGTK